MSEWVNRLKEYNSYMSNVISTVKSQAVQLNSQWNKDFTIEELVNRIKFFNNYDYLIKKSDLSIFVDVDTNMVIQGDISNMVQILDNLIKNAIESYEGKESEHCKVELHIRKNNDNVIFAVKDYGCGIPEKIKHGLFKYMLTTKGKSGTGLSLMLSYSTIKGKFGGDIWFESKENEGSTFFIMLPVNKKVNKEISL
ncbi:MAG TPA: HAMP domain-containing sensor histidine kinase [Acetivibrio clariflavus]|nr:HAMP domain-containing sensor histidine kinase [Acetivibrio clariflavus]